MAQDNRDGGQRSVVIALLCIVAFAAVSIAVLVATNGDSPKAVDKTKLVASATSVPTAGPLHDQLLAQCTDVVAELKPIADFLVSGLASVPAGAPKPLGTEQVSCLLGTNGDTTKYVASRFVGTTAAAVGASIVSAGWTSGNPETHGAVTETLFTQRGEIQIVVADVGNGQVVVVYS